MEHPEQGSGWEIIREFVEPVVAETAGRQVLKLIEEDSTFISRYPKMSLGHHLLEIYRLHAWSPSAYPDHPNTIVADKEQRELNQELLTIHRKACKTVSPYVTASQINVFEPQGRTRRHRDRSVGETIVVSLSGVGRVNLVDPVTRDPFEFLLYPGDGMHLINPREQAMRPRHVVKNIDIKKRVTLVV